MHRVMKKKSFMSALMAGLMIAGMCTTIVSCSKDEAEEDVYNQDPLSEYGYITQEGSISLLGDFVSFVEDGTGVMSRNTEADAPITNWSYIEVGENERYYVIPKRGEHRTALNAISLGTKVQFSGKLYKISEEFLSYKDNPEMKAATKLAELATKYKIYFLILPDMEDPDWQKCYIKGLNTAE